ncbi:NAD(P)-dependent oxidoreductase [[Acholeplasma] multilocale]|uniref:NAD(P)-dependent oxidoreductase n=1 Tax=[Acholeplasma] multilocale TaxID=264638 RepID=UPI00047B266C|nr:NAD(P)-dependent oxidoreductase [[Acholeplasma] multilocale]
MKIVCYGVRETEKVFFNQVNEKFNFQLTLVPELLTHQNIDTVDGHEAVLLRANCVADKINLEKMKEKGVKYLLTRTVGVNHIDIKEAQTLGFKMGYVPFYSPNAVSELAVSLGCGLLRNIFHTTNKTGNTKNFKVDNKMFAKEIRKSTIGVIGTGKIGYEVAKSWKGIGAKVLGFDIYPAEIAKEVLEYTDIENLISQSDLITLHCPFIKGENFHMIDEKFISKMKDGSYLVNTARGELVDPQALYDAIVNGKLNGAALDVVEQESEIFFKEYLDAKITIDAYEKLHSLYPQVVFTPHIGSYTDEAVTNMVETSFNNLKQWIENNSCINDIK